VVFQRLRGKWRPLRIRWNTTERRRRRHRPARSPPA